MPKKPLSISQKVLLGLLILIGIAGFAFAVLSTYEQTSYGMACTTYLYNVRINGAKFETSGDIPVYKGGELQRTITYRINAASSYPLTEAGLVTVLPELCSKVYKAVTGNSGRLPRVDTLKISIDAYLTVHGFTLGDVSLAIMEAKP